MSLIVLIATVFGIIITLLKTTQEKLTTKGYVVNVYLYVILAIMLCSLTVVAIDRYQLINLQDITGGKMFILFLVTLVPIFALAFIDKKNVLIRHVIWIIFIAAMGIIVYPIYDLTKNTDILWKSVATVIIMVIGLTIISSMVPENYFDSWGSYLLMALFALIVFQLVDIFFSNPNTLQSHQKIYAMIAIVLFSCFILFDTKKIYQGAPKAIAECGDSTNQLVCTDYPGKSLNMFLDILNLFTNVTSLQMNS